MTMHITLNGADYQLAAPTTVAELIATLNLSQQAIAVAVNRSIVARPLWSQHQLQAQDHVDVVRAIGGG